MTSTRRVATYERVSSEDQRDRETIKTQTAQLARQLDADPGVELVARFVDDGISGMVPMEARPDGARLLSMAAGGGFDELWIYSVDRLGRDDVDPLIVWRQLDRLGIKVRSIAEGEVTAFTFHIHVAVAAEQRRTLLAKMAAGMDRAAAEGRYTGGIVSYGYRVEGERQHAVYVVDDRVVWGEWTAADVVHGIYERLAIDRWTCSRIADELNDRAVPTAYAKDGRGVRRQRTQNRWGAGQVRNMVRNPMYKGERAYGTRSSQPKREIVTGRVPALVSTELWAAAQDTLDQNRRMAKNTTRIYLLRGCIRSAGCALAYTGTLQGRHKSYRCNGRQRGRGKQEAPCRCRTIREADLLGFVWPDIEAFLLHPEDALISEMADEVNAHDELAVDEAERITLGAALDQVAARRDRFLDLYTRGTITQAELDGHLDQLRREQRTLEQKRDALPQERADTNDVIPADLLDAIRRKLRAGMTDAEKQEIISLLVDVTVFSEPDAKAAKAVITYRFPRASTGNVRGSSPRSG